MEPKVTLVSSTEQPVRLMCWARRVMHAPVPDYPTHGSHSPEIEWLGESYDDYFNSILLKDRMPTFLEYVQVVFKLENVSRALTHQLVRHRIGFSYSQQSLRCVDLPNFANEQNYHNPYGEVNPEALDILDVAAFYHTKMTRIQEIYNKALAEGVPTQDARGLLPMNIGTTITFSTNLRALQGLINKRLCYKTQGEFNKVAQLMLAEVGKIDKRLLKFFGAPCEKSGKCMMEAENAQQLAEGKLTADQNTKMVCPKYKERH